MSLADQTKAVLELRIAGAVSVAFEATTGGLLGVQFGATPAPKSPRLDTILPEVARLQYGEPPLPTDPMERTFATIEAQQALADAEDELLFHSS